MQTSTTWFRHLLRAVEVCLWIVGALALGYVGYTWLAAEREQARAMRELEIAPDANVRAQDSAPAFVLGELVGKIEIPRLGLSTAIFEGTVEDSLKKGVGHLAGSSMPGESHNIVLAAHRDTFFRPLRDIQVGDEIDLSGRGEPYRYVVRSTKIVDPTETNVLDATNHAVVTLITCYPFTFVGHAPKRFIVQAEPLRASAPAVAMAVAAPEVAKPDVVKPDVVENDAPPPPSKKIVKPRLAAAVVKKAPEPPTGVIGDPGPDLEDSPEAAPKSHRSHGLRWLGHKIKRLGRKDTAN